jgi:hypothetical protein
LINQEDIDKDMNSLDTYQHYDLSIKLEILDTLKHIRTLISGIESIYAQEKGYN